MRYITISLLTLLCACGDAGPYMDDGFMGDEFVSPEITSLPENHGPSCSPSLADCIVN